MFGATNPSTPGSAFSFSAPPATTTAAGSGITGGFSFGAVPATTSTTQSAFTLGAPQPKHVTFGGAATTTAPAASGLFGTPATATPAGSNTLAGLLASKPTATTASTLTGGLQFGATPSTGSTAFGAAPSAAVTAFGTTPSSAATIFGATPAAASTAPATSGFSFGLTSSSAAPAASIFGVTSTSSTVSQGLGGVDPRLSIAGSGAAAGAAAKSGDSKAAIRETNIPNEMVNTVDEFVKHVKQQKSVRENIARMSSKPLYRVQDDIKNLNQQLSLVTSGLQRNAAAIEKLKKETTRELKHAEIAQRTKDTPQGLQYENTAPTEYFQRLAEEFEAHMQMYRQQILETEKHLASVDQSSSLTPQELSKLLTRLNDAFIVTAAQLQVVHSAVKEQKDAYLSFRRAMLGDTTDVFDRGVKAPLDRIGSRLVATPPTTVGPTPFSAMSNAAAVAMATALNRTQPSAGGATFSGLTTGATQPPSSGLGLGLSLAPPTTTAQFGLTATGTGALFSSGTASTVGTPANLTSGCFSPAGSLFGTTANAFGATPTLTLPKAPLGSKRGKNA